MQVHQSRVRKTKTGWAVTLLVRMTNGELRSFAGTALTPIEAQNRAWERAQDYERSK